MVDFIDLGSRWGKLFLCIGRIAPVHAMNFSRNVSHPEKLGHSTLKMAFIYFNGQLASQPKWGDITLLVTWFHLCSSQLDFSSRRENLRSPVRGVG